MINLSPSQLDVVENFPDFLMNNDKEMTISGFAGSGKSFLVEYLVQAADKQQKMLELADPEYKKKKLIFSATTNKAANVLGDMLNIFVPTIHRTLGLSVYNDYKTGSVRLIQKNKTENLTNSILFIDEASMIDQELLKYIRKIAGDYKTCKVVYIGDSYQLPPVMEDVCPVFTSRATNVYFLKEIQRQAQDNPIIQLSGQYRNVLDNPELSWPIIEPDNKAIFHYQDKKAYFAAIREAYLQPYIRDRYKILAWSNLRVLNYNNWVRKIQQQPSPFYIGETVVTNKPLFQGDSVMASTDTLHVIKNIEETDKKKLPGYWIQLETFENSWFFQPASWEEAQEMVKTEAKIAKETNNWKEYFDIINQWTDLRPVHASTVHKAQGSTYEEVFIDLQNIGQNTRWREVARLVYVALTRASHKVHIFGDLSKNYLMKPQVNLMEHFINVNDL